MSIFLCSCGKISHKAGNIFTQFKEKIVSVLSEPIVSRVSIFEKFPELKDNKYKIIQHEGIKCDYIPAFYKYYFVYKGDLNSVLGFVSRIKCTYTEIVPDTICNKTDISYFKNKFFYEITDLEKRKASFFFYPLLTDTSNLIVYDCIKTPEHHIIIFNKGDSLIYHLVENFRE